MSLDLSANKRRDIVEDDRLKPVESGDLTEHQTEQKPAGVKVLEQTERRLVVSVFAGKKYSLKNEAARVGLELNPLRKRGYLVEFTQEDFAAGTKAGELALSQAESQAEKAGIKCLLARIPGRELAKMPEGVRNEMVAALEKQGYRVEYVKNGSEGYPLLSAEKKIGAGRAAISDKEVLLEAPRADSPSHAQTEIRFTSKAELNSYLDQAIRQYEDTDAGRKLTSLHLEDITVDSLVKTRYQEFIRDHKGYDYLTYIAGLCEKSGMTPGQRGTTVHRIAELQALYEHPDEVLSGQLKVEQSVSYQQDLENHHVEIDVVKIQGDKHFIYDYKPVDLSEFEETKSGREWAGWMEQYIGADFREQIKGRLNPDSQKMRDAMPPDIRQAFTNMLREKIKQYKYELVIEKHYPELYARANRLDEDKVELAIRPYYVFNDGRE